MRLWNTLGFLLTILVCTSVRAHHEGKENGPETAHHNGIVSPNDSVLNTIAHKLNCSVIELYHKGNKIKPTSTSSPVNTKYTKHRGEPAEDEYDEDIHPNTENKGTEKPSKDENIKSKSSTGDVNPSKNVTDPDDHSNMTMSTAAEREPTKKSEPTDIPVTEVPVCAAPFYDDGGQDYNWYQILVENGGAPGKVNATRLTPNVTQILNPCERPIVETVPPLGDLLYNYTLVEFEKMFRLEEAFLRFAGTDSEFVDVHGHLVWSPPGYYRRYYILEYRYDDTGFYIKVHKGLKCIFSQNPVRIKCAMPSETCVCVNGVEMCGSSPWRYNFENPGLPLALIG